VAGAFQHVVLFRFPEELSEDEQRDMASQVRAWAGEVPGLVGLRFGADVSGRSGGWQYLLFTEFQDDDTHRAYYDHPLHQAFSKWVFDRNCEVVRFDYPLNDEVLYVG
jgi:stress responsive alpha/beta barrel protein